MGKSVYFISDMHLGAQTFDHPLDYERRVVRFLDSIKADCQALFLVGDVIDYWFEYKQVVPRGFTRFLGKLGEFTDAGIEVHWFTGNHDIWIFDYIGKETGAVVHHTGEAMTLQGKLCYIAHGDGLGHDSRSFKLMNSFFHSRVCQKMFRWIHPDLATAFAHKWSAHSRLTGAKFPDFLGENKEHIVVWTKQYIKELEAQGQPVPAYFIFGHRHIMLYLMLSRQTRLAILGDWIQHFSYGVLTSDGQFSLEQFEVAEEAEQDELQLRKCKK
ncbi:MAG: UDP-2,3-diacylglucosamine diphosphatase [Bacteroidales bacterium]|nr:UDP-2,3-diacylglucosamine diphosphatase [Bacteroidales bacterium]